MLGAQRGRMKGNEAAFERKVRPVYDALDSRNYKVGAIAQNIVTGLHCTMRARLVRLLAIPCPLCADRNN